MRVLTRSCLVFGLAIAGLLAVQAPASAFEPERTVFIDQGFATLPDMDCGTFTLHEEMTSERIQLTTFFDQDGNVVRTELRINFVGELTRSDTGQTYIDRVAGGDRILPDGTVISFGAKPAMVDPGLGAIVLTTGRKIYDPAGNLVFEAGPNDVDVTDLTQYCTVLP